MRIDVARDLTDSAFDFLRVVWPAIRDACGGGELIPVEAVSAGEFAKTLDVLAGIDAWQISDDGAAIRGIASRVQWDQPWNTFTVRFQRTSGAKTEYEKRCWTLAHTDEGWLYPALMSQGYVRQKRTGNLLSAAVARTMDVFDFIHAEPRVDWKTAMRDGRGWCIGKTSNATFIVVPWANLVRTGRWVTIVKGPDPVAPKPATVLRPIVAARPRVIQPELF